MKLAPLAAAAALLWGGAAAACSDLPNICEQAMQHHQNMIDIAATPPWEPEAYYADPPAYSAAEWVDWSGDLAAQRAPNPLPEQTAAYRAFEEGEWLFRGAPKGKPGQFCTATFLRQGAGVSIIGPGGGSPTALLAFFGPDVPAPRRMREAPAILRQTGEKPQKAQVYNAAMPDSAGYGMAIFATPSAKAALDGMLDRASFEIAMGKGPVVAVEWTGGAAARAWLRKCIGKGASG